MIIPNTGRRSHGGDELVWHASLLATPGIADARWRAAAPVRRRRRALAGSTLFGLALLLVSMAALWPALT